MAFNDVRISKKAESKVYESNMPSAGPSRPNLLTINGNKDRALRHEQPLKSDSAFDKILQDLDFDKVVR